MISQEVIRSRELWLLISHISPVIRSSWPHSGELLHSAVRLVTQHPSSPPDILRLLPPGEVSRLYLGWTFSVPAFQLNLQVLRTILIGPWRATHNTSPENYLMSVTKYLITSDKISLDQMVQEFPIPLLLWIKFRG